MTDYKYIEIEARGFSESGLTRRWTVLSKRGPANWLGDISWFARWRRYAFYPASNTVFTPGCLRDIAKFIDAVMKARKKK